MPVIEIYKYISVNKFGQFDSVVFVNKNLNIQLFETRLN